MYEYTIPTKAIITYTDPDWRLQDVLAREPGEHELLIKIVATGICHTDIANVGGIYPRILGHEGAGHILRKGPKVSSSFEIGDPVLLSFAHCKDCHMCVTGHPAHCSEQVPITIQGQDPNFALAEGEHEALEDDGKGKKRVVKASYFGHSSFSGIALVKESSVVSVNGLVSSVEDLRRFAPLGCGIQTGACAVANIIHPQPSDSVAVIGLGGVGLSAIMAAKALDVKTIIAIDILPNRLQLAQDLGATHTINSKGMSKDELTLAIRNLPPFNESKMSAFGPSGIVDTTGIPSILQAALAAVDRLGRVVQLANQGPGSFLSVGLPEHMRDGVHLTGTIQGDANPEKSIPMLIKWYREGKLPLEKLEKFFKVEEFEQARKEMHDGSTIKPVLIWPE
jgi:Zn-dependent alcohol dehydrogenase